MSTPDRARLIRDLFDEVSALPLEEQAVRLAEACGLDEALRVEVEALLESADAGASDIRHVLEALRPATGEEAGSDRKPREPPSSLRAALADRYRVEHEIGRGGMATVYLAEDLKHHRRVAIKVLDPDLAANVGANRFLREIETAANLTHPHILPLHDSGQANGFLYYVMPYVEGESLRARLDREPQLPVDDAVQIAREIADALSFAHEHGLVHRDVKPANVLLEAGHAVLADFGIAQAVAGADEGRLTGTGVSPGTPTYMSPEQARGGKEIDARSDLYSLGCVLYEMLTGEPPFTGRSAQAVLARKLAEPTPGLRTVREAVPVTLEQVTTRALAKLPADRYETVAEFAEALGDLDAVAPLTRPTAWPRAVLVAAVGTVVLALVIAATVATLWPSGVPVARDHRVAVLPLSNETGESSLDYVANWASEHVTYGLIEADLTQVVQYHDVALAVAASASGGETSADLSGTWPQETGATLAVMGAFYLLGDSVEFRLRIIDPEGTVQGTVESVRGKADDLSEALGVLQVRVVGAVGGVVSPGHAVTNAALGRHPPNPEALKLVLDGWEFALRGIGWEAAIPYFTRAHQLDPEFFTPLFVWAVVLGNLSRWAEADSVCQIMENSIEELTLTDRLSTERTCANVRGDLLAALDAAKRLTELSPNATSVLGNFYLAVNRPREAVEAFSRFDTDLSAISRAWAPYNSQHWSNALHSLGEYSRELEIVQEARAPFSEFVGLINAEIRALISLGRLEESEQLIGQRRSLLGPGQDPSTILNSAAREYDAHGYPELAEGVRRELVEWYSARTADQMELAESRRGKAEAMLFLDRDDEAQALLEPLADGFPGNLDDQGRLAVLRARQGDEAGARAISETLRDWPDPFLRGRNTLWRARIAAGSGAPEEAVRLLEQANAEGWGVNDNPHKDPYLKRLRGNPAFEEFLRPKG